MLISEGQALFQPFSVVNSAKIWVNPKARSIAVALKRVDL